MKLALVYPPFFAKGFNENLPTVDDEFGLFPHIGFGWVARGARAAGWDVRLWDAPATKMPLERVVSEVQDWSPDLVGFSAHACQTIRDMLSWARTFKAHTGLPALVGGYEAKAYPDEVLSHRCFDFLCGGEAHTFLPEFLPAFERGRDYDKVPDLVYRAGGGLKKTFAGPHQSFRDYPTPDRSIFPNDRYYSHISQRRKFTIGMSEVGCPYPCSFCCMRLSGYDARTAEQIVTEMEECIALGIREIDWFDPLMLHDRERALDIAREVKRRKLDIIWSCRSRVDSLSFHKSSREPDTELIETLAEGGCRRIYFGIESGDDQVLKNMMKGQTTTDSLTRTLKCVDEAGIMSLGFFIVGAPGDTRESVERTVRYSLQVPITYAQYQIAIIKPHTELEKRHIVEETGFDYWREYVKGNVDEYLLPTPWTEMSRDDLEQLAREAYFRFYARPGYAIRMLRRIESTEELVRYARVGFQLLLRPLRPKNAKSIVTRGARATATFVEAALTLLNPGARHPVFKEGGGLRAALRLAYDELSTTAPRPQLTKEIAEKLRARIEATREPVESPRPIHDRYVTVFEEMRAAENGETTPRVRKRLAVVGGRGRAGDGAA